MPCKSYRPLSPLVAQERLQRLSAVRPAGYFFSFICLASLLPLLKVDFVFKNEEFQLQNALFFLKTGKQSFNSLWKLNQTAQSEPDRQIVRSSVAERKEVL